MVKQPQQITKARNVSASNYIPPAALICKVLGVRTLATDDATVMVSTRGLREILLMLLAEVRADGTLYKQDYWDIVDHIKAEQFRSDREHYIRLLGITSVATEEATLTVSTRGLRELLGSLLTDVYVDDSWYKSEYPDIENAIGTNFRSAKEHYVRLGYFEGRFPSRPVVDEGWYLVKNADVARALLIGVIPDGQTHFMAVGYQQGRAGISRDGAVADQWRAIMMVAVTSSEQ